MHGTTRPHLILLVSALVVAVAGPFVIDLVPYPWSVTSWYVVGVLAAALAAAGMARWRGIPWWVPTAGVYAGALVAFLATYRHGGVDPLGLALLAPALPAFGVLMGPTAWLAMVVGAMVAGVAFGASSSSSG